MAVLNLGDTYIYGHSPEQARLIMATCRDLGIDPMTVRTTDDGFIVPDEVADEIYRQQQPRWAPDAAVF